MRTKEKGEANVEFALCAIFIIFLIISIFDMARGLWIQHTLAEAVRDGTRYAIVHGGRFVDPTKDATTYPANRLSPGGTLGDLVNVILQSAVGIVPGDMDLIFTSQAGTKPCKPSTSCTSDTSPWPPPGGDGPSNPISISAFYPYNSIVVMYFPGTKGMRFGNYILGSTARELVVF